MRAQLLQRAERRADERGSLLASLFLERAYPLVGAIRDTLNLEVGVLERACHVVDLAHHPLEGRAYIAQTAHHRASERPQLATAASYSRDHSQHIRRVAGDLVGSSPHPPTSPPWSKADSSNGSAKGSMGGGAVGGATSVGKPSRLFDREGEGEEGGAFPPDNGPVPRMSFVIVGGGRPRACAPR